MSSTSVHNLAQCSHAAVAFAKQRVVHADAFDLYVSTSCVVKLIDFNPYGGTTQPLLFTWEEIGNAASIFDDKEHESKRRKLLDSGSPCLCSDEASEKHVGKTTSDVELRVVEDAMHIQPAACAALGAPADVHMHLAGSGWSEILSLLQQHTLAQS